MGREEKRREEKEEERWEREIGESWEREDYRGSTVDRESSVFRLDRFWIFWLASWREKERVG